MNIGIIGAEFQRLSLKLDSALTAIDPDDPRDQLRASRIIGDQTNRVRKELRAALDPSHLEADARFLKRFMVGCIRKTATAIHTITSPIYPWSGLCPYRRPFMKSSSSRK